MQTALHILTTYAMGVAALLLILIGALSRRWPAALDAALVALYGYTASPRVLVLAAALAAVRWVPPFAAQVAQALGVPSWGGLSLPFALFALPGLAVYTTAPRQEAPSRAPAALPPVVAATGRTTRLAETHARTLAPAEWLRAVNDDPTAPHLGVVGPTRLGKTTFVLAAVGRRAGELVICTPKGADVDPWGGADVSRITIDLTQQRVDWQPIADAINRVYVEMLSRYASNSAAGATRITLIIDELSTTLANTPKNTKAQILEMWNMGAGANITLITIDPEANARAYGVEGRRDILSNMQFAKVEPGRLWCLGRLGPNGEILSPIPLETDALVALAADARLAGRGWPGVSPVAGGGTAPAGAPGGVPTTPPPAPVVGNGTGNGNEEQTIAALMKLRSAGISRDAARAMGLSFRDEFWTKAGERIGNN